MKISGLKKPFCSASCIVLATIHSWCCSLWLLSYLAIFSCFSQASIFSANVLVNFILIVLPFYHCMACNVVVILIPNVELVFSFQFIFSAETTFSIYKYDSYQTGITFFTFLFSIVYREVFHEMKKIVYYNKKLWSCIFSTNRTFTEKPLHSTFQLSKWSAMCYAIYKR